jgi:hypothetical protein
MFCNYKSQAGSIMQKWLVINTKIVSCTKVIYLKIVETDLISSVIGKGEYRRLNAKKATIIILEQDNIKFV